jgi:hypothetical protein
MRPKIVSKSIATPWRLGVLVAAAIALAGCAGPIPITTPTQVGSYNPGMLSYVASRGGMPVEVHGNPFGGPQQAFERKVADTLTTAHRGPSFPVTPGKAEGQQGAYRLVMVFNGSTSGYRICSNPSGQTSSGSNVTVAAAFCHNDKWITTVGGRTTASGFDDPAFGRLMQQVAASLLPARSPDQDGGNDFDG